jgi:transcriptional regulator with XRE-family HTH domain
MPRRAQNPHNVLTRLRRQLSTPEHTVSREELAQRTGVPLGSIKALESGRYSLTSQIALKISLGVPVNPIDLFKGADPLRDFTGRQLSADSKMLEEIRAPYLSERPGFETDQFVSKLIFEAAEKKSAALQFRFLFREALTETAKLLGLESAVAEELSKHMGEFDPAQVASQLRPRQGDSAKRWETYETLLRMEEDRLWMDRQGQEPSFQITSEMSDEEKQRLNWESVRFEADIRAEALANVAKKAKKPR